MDADAQTDTPVMSDIVNKTYDLNANASSSADDYLNGVRNIHQQILEAQASGSLTAPDANKITKQVNDLTGKKLSDATQTAGMEFYDANQQFNQLPPEYRGQATRALFYAGSGQNFTPQQYKAQATQIMQQINDQRRAQAQKTVNGIAQGDTEFLKTVPNATPEAKITATAKKYGISEHEVILQLRAQAVAKVRAQKNGVKHIAPGGGEDDREEEPKPVQIHRGDSPNDAEDDQELMQ